MWNNEEEKSQKRRRMVARTGTVGEKQKKRRGIGLEKDG